jgi:2-hydroxychromene-2-carboxylate isomerase
MATLELYFDLRSPYTYMATTQIAGMAARTGSDITYAPSRILELMKLVGNRSTNMESPNKNRYGKIDLARWPLVIGCRSTPIPSCANSIMPNWTAARSWRASKAAPGNTFMA